MVDIRDSDDCKVMLLGPEQSGKTNLILGLYLASRQMVNRSNCSSSLKKLYYNSFGHQTWPDATVLDEVDEFTLEFDQHELLPDTNSLQMMDYPGEIFPNIAHELVPTNRSIQPLTVEQHLDPTDELLEFLFEADVIMLLVEGPSLATGSLDYIDRYLEYIDYFSESGGETPELLPVITKIDKIVDKLIEHIADQTIRHSLSKNDSSKNTKTKIESFENNYASYKAAVNRLVDKSDYPFTGLEFHPIAINPETRQHSGLQELLNEIADSG